MMEARIILPILFTLLSITSCTYPKNSDIGAEKKNDYIKLKSIEKITINDIYQCKFDHDYMNFCTEDYLNLYNKKISEKANFASDKILLIINKERDSGKGTPRKVKYIVVLDPLRRKVYPLNQSVGNFVDGQLQEIVNQPPKIFFKNNDNKICISGTMYAYGDNDINVEKFCYKFDLKSLYGFSKITNPKEDGAINNIEISKLPYNSEKHIKCIERKERKCENLYLIPTAQLSKKYDFINIGDGDSVLFKLRDLNSYIMVSPFSERGVANLRIMKVNEGILEKEMFIMADKNVSISNNFILRYKEGSEEKSIKF